MSDVLAAVTGGLRELDIEITATEMCEALWLAAQDFDDLPHGMPSPTADGDAASDEPVGPSRRRRRDRRDQVWHRKPSGARLYSPAQIEPGAGDGLPAMTISLPDAPALPHAGELAAILRPLRYDHRRIYATDAVDEEATALTIALAGVRRVIWQTTRRRRVDLDLVLDVGGSGPLWTRLAAELRAMLATLGTFRSLRFWVLNSDAPDLPLLPLSAITGQSAAWYPYTAVCEPPRTPLVVVLTDGTGHAWQSKDAYRPLREWAARGTVLTVQLLPPRMWNQTSLRALPVLFHPASDGYHSGARIDVSDDQLAIIGLRRSDLSGATAIPVIGLDAGWLRSWLPLTQGAEAGAVPGYALLIPGPDSPPAKALLAASDAPADERIPTAAVDLDDGDPADGTRSRSQPELTAERRYQRFMLTASPDARRLARLMSTTGRPSLPGMRKIRHELMPRSSPDVLAEVLLSGLIEWAPTPVAEAMSGNLQLSDFVVGVRDLLRERPGGVAELRRDTALVDRALRADPGSGRTYDVIAVGPGISGLRVSVPTEPALLEPYPVPRDLPVFFRARPAADPETMPDRPVDELADVLSDDGVSLAPGSPEVRIGIWGSPTSGRTTYLTTLAMMGMADQWTDWRRGEQWRVLPADAATRRFIVERVDGLERDGRFPSATMKPQPLSFRLERRRRQGLRAVRFRRREPMATISLALQDAGGGDYVGDTRPDSAAEYLANAQVLVYFFDPIYDESTEYKDKSVDVFETMMLEISRLSVGRRHDRFPPQHLAVCVAKLDEQHVFDIAVDYGCLQTERRTGLPWVPPQLARQLFEAITYDQGTISAYQLRTAASTSFHPKRTSFHALSSIGFYVPDDGVLNRHDVCNVEPEQTAPASSDTSVGSTRRKLRGTIRPVHVLDPLITLVERYAKQAGRS